MTNFKTVWKVLLGLVTLVTASFAVDNRYVTEKVFTEFKSGTIAAIFDRLDKLDNKSDKINDKLDRLLEKER